MRFDLDFKASRATSLALTLSNLLTNRYFLSLSWGFVAACLVLKIYGQFWRFVFNYSLGLGKDEAGAD